MANKPLLPEAQLGPAEKLLDLVLNSSAHLWHNRPGLDIGGKWTPAKNAKKVRGGKPVKPRSLRTCGRDPVFEVARDLSSLVTDDEHEPRRSACASRTLMRIRYLPMQT